MRSSRNTASRPTSATSRRVTRRASASMGRPRSIGVPLRRSVTRNQRRSTRAAGRRAEWRAVFHYSVRGYRILGRNVWAGRYEVDLIVRRGRRLVFCEVKSKGGGRYGDPLEMVGPEKVARLRQAAASWLALHPELDLLELSFEVVAVRGRQLERVVVTL